MAMMMSDACHAGKNARAELSKSLQDHGTAQQPVAADGAHASPLNRGMGIARGESRSEADTVTSHIMLPVQRGHA